MRAYGAFWLTLMLITPLECNAAPLVRLSSKTSVEPIKSLSISELWKSTPLKAAEGKNVMVEFQMFDTEDRPRKGAMYGCGWLLIGTGDVGSLPVGVKVWSDGKCNLVVLPAKDAGAGADERFTLSVGTSEVFEIRVASDSNVSIAGHVIGVIEQ